tara:strand:- start:3099 stop:3887 length:789 start_codon:yes stop_codon:yes gene_type:complete
MNSSEYKDDETPILDEKETIMNEKEEKKIPFWGEDPNVLFQQKYIFEFFPVESMTYEQKLNAISRTVLVLSIIGLVISKSVRILVIILITFGAIFLLHYYHNKEKDKKENTERFANLKEGFENPALEVLEKKNVDIPDHVFQEPDSSNPFGNVLVSDYDYNPDRKPAPPAFNKNVNEKILTQAKKFVSEANPDQPEISEKLFSDLGSNMQFEQSMRQFTSNPNTTIPNDQGAFADFCYGSMISCKEGNEFACARNLTRHTNY